ncbi:MAG: TonB-dependent receptor plug domain-containing protein [Bacteroidota bacterium]
MERKTGNRTGSFTFRKWSRKGYSLFRMLKNVVHIGVLAIVYHQASARVNPEVVTLTSDTVSRSVELEEIIVGTTRTPLVFPDAARIVTVIAAKELQKMPAASLQEVLRYIQGVDIRQRGPAGIQADISLRGGSFDQTMILLNGINITDPQTGHHNLNIPVSLSQIDRIEVLEGPASRIYGPNAFSGAVNIITKAGFKDHFHSRYTAGSHGFSDIDLSGSLNSGKFSQTISVNTKSSDGYTDNTDFEVRNLYTRTVGRFDEGMLDLQLGLTSKAFGANSFYSARFPEQFEKTGTMFTSLKWTGTSPIHLSPAIYWRRHHDRFELFRNDKPSWYAGHNYHMTDIFGMTVNSWFESKLGKTAAGAEIRNENIWSNVLGDPLKTPVKVPGEDALFTRFRSRTGFSLFAEHTWTWYNLYVNAGILAQRNTDLDMKWRLYPGADVGYQLFPELKLYATAGKSLRLPTFTDLYYTGPTNIGNAELKPEEVFHRETGLKYAKRGINGHISYFIQNGKNLIDWVKLPGNDIWQTQNHTAIRTTGFQIHTDFRISDLTAGRSPVTSVSAGYHTTQLKKEESEYISYYALDYLRHKLTLSLQHKVIRNISSWWTISYQDRNGTYTDYRNGSPEEKEYSPFWLADWRLNYSPGKIGFNLEITNILDRKYRDIGSIAQPGRWIKAGISFSLE